MSAFDTALDCTRGMIECLNQNHFETPPYGPVPSATSKLRVSLNAMIDALIIAMDAESQGITMPEPPTIPTEEVEGAAAMLRQEHVLHREHAEALKHLVDATAEPTPAPEPEPEPEHRRGRRHDPEALHSER